MRRAFPVLVTYLPVPASPTRCWVTARDETDALAEMRLCLTEAWQDGADVDLDTGTERPLEQYLAEFTLAIAGEPRDSSDPFGSVDEE